MNIRAQHRLAPRCGPVARQWTWTSLGGTFAAPQTLNCICAHETMCDAKGFDGPCFFSEEGLPARGIYRASCSFALVCSNFAIQLAGGWLSAGLAPLALPRMCSRGHPDDAPEALYALHGPAARPVLTLEYGQSRAGRSGTQRGAPFSERWSTGQRERAYFREF